MTEALTEGEDPGWRWTWMAIARLLSAGLVSGPSQLPREYLNPVLGLLETLLGIDEKTPGARDALDQSINTVRGVASEGILRWTLRRGTDEPEESRRIVPEASAVLEQLLGRDHGSSPLPMIGLYLPDLVALDEQWVGDHLDALFPTDETLAESVVWRTFLVRREPNLKSFRRLAGQYERAVETLGSFAGDKDQADALVHHLVQIYWSGHLSLDEGLFSRFYATADGRARVEVLRYVGGAFLHTPGEVAAGIVEQARALWERRLEVAQLNPTPEGGSEAAEFGWWFASAKFETVWSMRQLDAALELTRTIELDYAVAERLGALVDKTPADAMRLLLKLMANASDWSIIGCRQGVEAAVKAALASESRDAQSLARELVSRLAARGHDSFMTLLGA